MKKVYLLGLIITLITSGSLIGQNMVINGDLEVWDDDNTPTSWTKIESITKEAVNIHGGSFSAAHMSNEGTTDFSQNVEDIVGGQQYRIQYYYLDNVTNARTRIWAYWADASGTNISDNGDVLRPGTYSEDNAEWMHYDVTLVAPATAAQFKFEVRVYKQDGTWDGYVYYDDFSVEANVTNDPEPTNYPTDLAAAPSDTKIVLTWTDAIGDQLPLSYVIMGNNDGSSFTPPVDGTPVEDDTNWDDGNIAMNVLYGVQTYSISVDANTDYTFTIYPFTNTGDIIDYKTDGTPPAASATSSNSVVVNQESFDSDLGSWTGFTVIGDQVWEWASYGVPPGCAKMNGFSGAAVANEDWLISPSMNLTSFESVSFSFDQARNYASNEGLFVLVSTDYDGSSDPSTNGTWNDITSSYTFPDPGSWDFMEAGVVDVSAYTGVNTYFAFKYTSTDSDASTWEIDNALIYGITGIGIIESPKVNFSFYPNPGVDFVYVDADTEGSVKIYSISGQLLIDEPVNEGVNNIDINALSQGTYLLQFSNAKGNSSTKKLIVR